MSTTKISLEMQDERYQIADEAICEAFLMLLNEKDLNKITVSDVIKKAGIVRSTFYNHYENISALICAIEDKTLHDIFSLMETFHPKNNQEICRFYFKSLCRYTQTNVFLASVLKGPSPDKFFRKAITLFHQYVKTVTQQATPSRHSKEEYSYMVASCIGSTLGVLHKWSRDSFSLPVDEVAEILTYVFLNGMFPYMS